MKTNRLGKSRGFSLAEVLIVGGIVAALAAIAIPNFMKAKVNSLRWECYDNRRTLMERMNEPFKEGHEIKLPNMADLQASRPGGRKITCPSGGEYRFVGTSPLNCKISCSTHIED